MDPSRLIDIPKIDDESAGAAPTPRPASPRLTFEGHPGFPRLVRPESGAPGNTGRGAGPERWCPSSTARFALSADATQ